MAVLGRKMDGDLDSAEAKGQRKGKGRAWGIAWRGKEGGGRDGKQDAVHYIPALPQARGAAQVQVAKSSWRCWAQNFGDLGDSAYLGLGVGKAEARGLRQRQALTPAQPTAEGLGWARGSVLGRPRHNHLLERNPAIKLTAQIADFCLDNYTRLLSVHSLRHRHIRISILSTQPGEVLYLGDMLHLLIYSIYIAMYKDV